MWLFQSSMKKHAAVSLKPGIPAHAKTSRKPQKKETITTWCAVVKYLLELNATDDVIAETDAKMMRLTQALNLTLIEYAETV